MQAIGTLCHKLSLIVAHPNRAKYLNQRIFVVRLLDCVHLVPFVEDQSSFFLKTIIREGEGNRRLMPSLRSLTLKLIRSPIGSAASFM
jgi:hypothetical protein